MRLILLRFIIDVIYCFGRWWAMNGTIMEVSLEELLLNPLLGLLARSSIWHGDIGAQCTLICRDSLPFKHRVLAQIFNGSLCHFDDIVTGFIRIEKRCDVRLDTQSLSWTFNINLNLATGPQFVRIAYSFSRGILQVLTILERAIHEFRFRATVRYMYGWVSVLWIIALCLQNFNR